ncbi:MAG: hypothetical protein FalmKO_25990 [Falsiruegeria mediterranea]
MPLRLRGDPSGDKMTSTPLEEKLAQDAITGGGTVRKLSLLGMDDTLEPGDDTCASQCDDKTDAESIAYASTCYRPKKSPFTHSQNPRKPEG